MATIKIKEKSGEFKLRDNIKLKGDFFTLDLEYEVNAEPGHPSKATYFDKFVAYFAQDAAGKWNAAAGKATKAVKAEFDQVDQDCKKEMEELKKKGTSVDDQQKAFDKMVAQESKKFKNKVHNAITDEIGQRFIEKSHEAAEKRIIKEGNKLKKSKAKIAWNITKLVLKVSTVVAAAMATAATGGAAAPLLVATVAWVAFSTGTAKKILEGVKIVDDLRANARKDVDQMEKLLAELDNGFSKCVKFANSLNDKADRLELETEHLQTEIKDMKKSLKQVNEKSRKHAKVAKDVKGKGDQLEKLLKDIPPARDYAEPLRKSFNQFREVKNNTTWGTKLEKAKGYVAAGKDLGSLFHGFVKMIDADS